MLYGVGTKHSLHHPPPRAHTHVRDLFNALQTQHQCTHKVANTESAQQNDTVGCNLSTHTLLFVCWWLSNTTADRSSVSTGFRDLTTAVYMHDTASVAKHGVQRRRGQWLVNDPPAIVAAVTTRCQDTSQHQTNNVALERNQGGLLLGDVSCCKPCFQLQPLLLLLLQLLLLLVVVWQGTHIPVQLLPATAWSKLGL